MKTLTKSLVKTDKSLVKDTFFVLLGLSSILLIVVILDYYHLIKAYSWQ